MKNAFVSYIHRLAWSFRPFVLGLFSVGCCVSWSQATIAQDSPVASLRKALSFHASFDNNADADFARGDRAIWQATSMNNRDEASKGLPTTEEVKLEKTSGRFGGAMRFNKSKGPMVFYQTDKNFPAPARNWSATVSFWLSTDPQNELLEGFCDPIQITSKQWDDAAMFVEFEKRASGIPFRLGVYADKKVWNPTGRNFDDIPMVERPLATVEKPPFARGKWTHVAFSIANFNTDQPNGTAILYLDGNKVGELSSRVQTFTWEPRHAAAMLGLNYIGWMDDLAFFDRALSAEEITALFSLKDGAKELHSKK